MYYIYCEGGTWDRQVVPVALYSVLEETTLFPHGTDICSRDDNLYSETYIRTKATKEVPLHGFVAVYKFVKGNYYPEPLKSQRSLRDTCG